MSNALISDTDAIFARAYAAALKSKFQLDVGNHFCILTSPVTLRGMAAGDLIYPQMTNFFIYKCADALQYSDNPSYTSDSAGSYIQQLRSYIEWIKARHEPPVGILDRLDKAVAAAMAANANYAKVLEEARRAWFPHRIRFPDFWKWAGVNYPALAAADRMRKAAKTELYQVMQLYYGPDAPIIMGYLDNIENAQSQVPFPGYNMDGLIDDDLIEGAIKYANNGQKAPEQPIQEATIRVPAYTIQGYYSTVQAWITASKQGASRDQVLTIDINQGRNTKWEDYGFKEVYGGSGFWPFFSAEVYVDGKWESRILDTNGRENEISLQLAMIGTAKFDLQPGQWDVNSIKTLFPSLRPGAPDVLGRNFAKIVSVVAGYDVELIVKFGAPLREEVNKIYEEVKKTSGRMSIFGFMVAASRGGSSRKYVETKFSDVKWDKTTGMMSLTPTKDQVYPTILGVITQRFD